MPTQETNSLAIILSVFTQHVEAGGRGTLRVDPGVDGARRVNLTIDLKDGLVRRRKKTPGQLRRDKMRREAWLRRKEGGARSPPEKEDSYASTCTSSPTKYAELAVSDPSNPSLERGEGLLTEAPNLESGGIQSSDLDQSIKDVDPDSIGRKKYHQAVLKMEDFKLFRNYSVKLHSHKACTIPNKKIDSIKACNSNPDSGGMSYLTHSCSKCIDNPPLVKTVKNDLGQITYQVHESVEEFKVCTPCTKYKTSKVCTLLNKTMIQKKEASCSALDATEDRDDVNSDAKSIDDLYSLLEKCHATLNEKK